VRAWGDPAAPTVVLLHGGAAHSGWWDHSAPFLADRFRVLAPDLSGHGDSDWRPDYSLDTWADELAAVIEEHASPGPLLVGHSMGGHVALTFAQRAADKLSGVIIVDSELRRRDDPPRPRPWSTEGPRRALHPDQATILSRFRTMPDECWAPPAVLRDVARQSVVRHADGWSWKFDRRFSDHVPLRMEDLAPLSCPVLVVRGERGLVDDAMATAAATRLRPNLASASLATSCVAGAGHHVPLEEPQQLAALVAASAADWTDDTQPRPPEDR
jgi:pimeloyl-ACP methyl ester carboxylesterase